jgi:hypothetical protein
MCELAGMSQACFYRHWARQEPTATETEIRAAVERLVLAHRHYGYRRIAALVHWEELASGAKAVRRLITLYIPYTLVQMNDKSVTIPDATIFILCIIARYLVWG